MCFLRSQHWWEKLQCRETKSVTLHTPALDSRFMLSHLPIHTMSIIRTINFVRQRTAVERHWFMPVEVDGYLSHIPSVGHCHTLVPSEKRNTCSELNQDRHVCLLIHLPVHSALPIAHTIHSDVTMCDTFLLTVYDPTSRHGSDHWINTSPFTLKSDTTSRRCHRCLV